MGHKFYGLLDSGANKTVISARCLETLKALGLYMRNSKVTSCTLANGKGTNISGVMSLPIKLQNRVIIIDAYVIPDLKPTLILGLDFWRSMELMPDFKAMRWNFNGDDMRVDVNSIVTRQQLTFSQQQRLNELLDTYFNKMSDQVGCTSLVKHVIRTDSPPIRQRSYRVNPLMQKIIDDEVNKMLDAGIIEPSSSAWSSPVLLVPKPDGTYRFCVDFRRLNKVSLRDSYPIPYMSSILDRLGNAQYLSSVDIKSAYWTIELEENSKQYTAFAIPGRGLFQFRRMPYGLHNGPATWQRFVDTVLGPELEPYCFVYLDDVIVATSDFDTHLKVLREVLDRLTKAGLTLSRGKCKICLPELRYLGYIVNAQGISVDPEKISVILKLDPPNNIKQVRSFLGMVGWYRRFIPNFAELITPISKLLRKGQPFCWDVTCDVAFNKIRNLLVSKPILACPNFELPFTVQTDASAFALGAVLTQSYEDGDRVICYLSRTLTRQEQNFSTTERECLAVIWAIEKLRPYLEGQKFSVITDHHSLVWLQNLKDPVGRLARWALRLQSYDYEIIHRKGKEHVVPDFLSRIKPSVASCEIKDSFVTTDRWYSKLIASVENKPSKFPTYRIVGGRLYKHVKRKFSILGTDNDSWREVIPKERRSEILRLAHDVPTSGHCGVSKTLHRVSSKYYWPKLKSDVLAYIKRCHTCAQYKPEQQKSFGLMSSRPHGNAPWQVISMDVVGPLPRSNSYAYILVVTCSFSKFVLTFPMRNATGKVISRLVEDHVFLLFGVPVAIITDNGSQFKCREFRELCNSYDVQLWYNAVYHPQANPTERVNRTLKTMLSSFVKDNHRTWSRYLPKVSCAIRTSVHEVTKHTPYFVNFGREHVISGKDHAVFRDIVRSDHGYGSDNEEKSRNRSEEFRLLFEEIRDRIRKAHERSKQRYDLRRRPANFREQDVVYVRNHVLSDASKGIAAKLAPKFVGPYKVKKKVSYLTYELIDNDQKSKGIHHAQDMKLATEDDCLV